MNLEEIKLLWNEFYSEWYSDESHSFESLDGKEMTWKPQFFDFMQWLSAKK